MTFTEITWTEYVPILGPPEPTVHPVSPDEHHWLIGEDETEGEGPERLWCHYIEHPESCAICPGGIPLCGVAYEVDNMGIPEEMLVQQEGRWRIESWFEFYPGGPWGGPEADAGLRWIDEPKHIGDHDG